MLATLVDDALASMAAEIAPARGGLAG